MQNVVVWICPHLRPLFFSAWGVTLNSQNPSRALFFLLSCHTEWSWNYDNAIITGSRFRTQVATFQNSLWAVGGYTTFSGGCKNESWVSFDGLTWMLASNSVPISRAGHSLVAFNGMLIVAGGYECGSTTGYTNQVWSSSDGVSWVLQPNAPFGNRGFHATVVFNSTVVVIAGSGSATFNDVYATNDPSLGWTKIHAGGVFNGRYNHPAAVFNNRVFFHGGNNAGTIYSDLWSSGDGGATWSSITVINNPLAALEGHAMVAYAGRLFIMGGQTGGVNVQRLVYSCVDPTNWAVAWTLPGAGRSFFATVPWQNSVWVGLGLNTNWNVGSPATDSYLIVNGVYL